MIENDGFSPTISHAYAHLIYRYSNAFWPRHVAMSNNSKPISMATKHMRLHYFANHLGKNACETSVSCTLGKLDEFS